MPKPLVFLILDGWGQRQAAPDNAISLADTPVWDRLMRLAAHTALDASGEAVGLPTGQMGNSEVGHLCIGSGQVVEQSLPRIDRAIASGAFESNQTLIEAMRASAGDNAVHILGLLSPGGVHSHERHLHAALNLAARNASRVYLHAFLDGRDTPPRSAADSLRVVEDLCAELSAETEATVVRLASICGRYYAMDRDRRWERTEKAWKMLFQGCDAHADDAASALKQAYARDESDEFVQPTSVGDAVTIKDGDSVIWMNFRADRARQLCEAMINPDFDAFARPSRPSFSTERFVTLTRYADEFSSACAFEELRPSGTLGEALSAHGLRQYRIAETEKYAHVTFFFNGGREEPFKGETRQLIPSPSVATYDLCPEMSAAEITDHIVEEIGKGEQDVIICNYANGDMVGHTGNLQAAIAAVEAIDRGIGRILEELGPSGECLITADHGNCEQMSAEDNDQAHTAHTCRFVPFVYSGPRFVIDAGIDSPTLSDVAPSVLSLLGLPVPENMSGRTLLKPR